MKKFQVSKSLTIDFPTRAPLIWEYLEQPTRLLTAMTSATQVQEIQDSTFQVKLHSLEFMHLMFQPIVDLVVWTKPEGKLCLQSSNCRLKGSEQLQQSFALDFNGQLSSRQGRSFTRLAGEADLAIAVDLPPVLQLMPEVVLEKAVETFLYGILTTFTQRLEQRLVQDYYDWAKQSRNQRVLAA
ncbi:DUF1997 domain-containing protein [Lyngbya confervoides]|uniref:DUF1997 domain-containing protein n=1 Tax=Lyngbya confervoides BDU141951 TaxID=1574623 RepID=A0ABD4T924_9CYAN|nr:DUF1997 domain-containing protein [Lyngbya confervoides]MCM1985072.1 DUF1997 domain-containing protein [Lyngbya confervoides BDU141951]